MAIGLLIALPVVLKLSRGGTEKMVDLELVTGHALTPTVLASGTLTYESQVTLAPEVTGRIKEILVAEGDQVKRDQLLMRLDPAASRDAIEQSKAQVRQAKLSIERRQVDFDAQVIKVKRYETLQDKGMVDANSLEALVSERNLAEVDLRTSREALSQALAQLSQAEEMLAKTEIRSPLDGKVTAIYVKVGQTAVPSFSGISGSILVDVANTASIDAEINVDETDIARVRLGAQARVVPAAFPDKTLLGVVDQVSIAPRIQAGQNKSYPVRIRLTNTAGVIFILARAAAPKCSPTRRTTPRCSRCRCKPCATKTIPTSHPRRKNRSPAFLSTRRARLPSAPSRPAPLTTATSPSPLD
jgi:HlyD family secretion protein